MYKFVYQLYFNLLKLMLGFCLNSESTIVLLVLFCQLYAFIQMLKTVSVENNQLHFVIFQTYATPEDISMRKGAEVRFDNEQVNRLRR